MWTDWALAVSLFLLAGGFLFALWRYDRAHSGPNDPTAGDRP